MKRLTFLKGPTGPDQLDPTDPVRFRNNEDFVFSITIQFCTGRCWRSIWGRRGCSWSSTGCPGPSGARAGERAARGERHTAGGPDTSCRTETSLCVCFLSLSRTNSICVWLTCRWVTAGCCLSRGTDLVRFCCWFDVLLVRTWTFTSERFDRKEKQAAELSPQSEPLSGQMKPH